LFRLISKIDPREFLDFEIIVAEKMKAMGTFKEWDTKFQNRIKMAVIVTSRIFEFNLKRWKEIQG
jgi:hypothetical protein